MKGKEEWKTDVKGQKPRERDAWGLTLLDLNVNGMIYTYLHTIYGDKTKLYVHIQIQVTPDNVLNNSMISGLQSGYCTGSIERYAMRIGCRGGQFPKIIFDGKNSDCLNHL